MRNIRNKRQLAILVLLASCYRRRLYFGIGPAVGFPCQSDIRHHKQQSVRHFYLKLTQKKKNNKREIKYQGEAEIDFAKRIILRNWNYHFQPFGLLVESAYLYSLLVHSQIGLVVCQSHALISLIWNSETFHSLSSSSSSAGDYVVKYISIWNKVGWNPTSVGWMLLNVRQNKGETERERKRSSPWLTIDVFVTRKTTTVGKSKLLFALFHDAIKNVET